MSRGRPRKIDPSTALEAAMLMFWQKGFEGTSMADLCHATGMAKPGLYAVFGDKEALYKKALTHYFDELGAPLIDNLMSSKDSLKVTMHRFLSAIAGSVSGNGTPKGCFIVNSSGDCAAAGPELKQLSKSLNLARRDALRARFDRAVVERELQEGADTAAFADFFAGQSAALAGMAQTGASPGELEAMVDVAITVLP